MGVGSTASIEGVRALPQLTGSNVPPQRATLPAVSKQQRVQYAILLQILEHETANRRKTAAVCPRTDHSDFDEALLHLLSEGSLAAPTPQLATLAELAEGGWLTVTDRGRARLYGENTAERRGLSRTRVVNLSG